MGSIASKFVQHSLSISGNQNRIWIVDGARFNITALLDPAIERLLERIQNASATTNLVIIMNILCIVIIVILSIVFLCLKYSCQRSRPETSSSSPASSIQPSASPSIA